MEHAGHLGDDLQLLMDGQLPAERRAAVDSHLAGCRRCRRELNALRRLKAVVREELPRYPLPAELEGQVRAAAAAEAATPGRGIPASSSRRRWRVAALAISLAAAAALVLLFVKRSRADFVAGAVRQFTEHGAAGAILEEATTDPKVLQGFFTARGLPFPTRVFDFGMMGYGLLGGSIERLADRQGAVFVYQNQGGRRVLCEMFQGTLSELPAQAEEREHNGIRFRIYRAAGLTLVFWQEGAVVCVLVADVDPEEAIQLAFAKAVRG